jgi:putative lipoprotein
MSLLLALALLGQLFPTSQPDSLPRPLACSSYTRPLDHLTTGPLPHEPDRWFAMDKFWHFSASFVTVGAAYHFGEDRARLSGPLSTGIALGGTITLGVTKEFYDLAGPSRHFSWKDLVADAAGIGAGYLAFIHRF